MADGGRRPSFELGVLNLELCAKAHYELFSFELIEQTCLHVFLSKNHVFMSKNQSFRLKGCHNSIKLPNFAF